MAGKASAEEAMGMGRIMKFGIERLEHRNFEVKLDCPNCGSARIGLSSGNGSGHVYDVRCPKCGTDIILDGLSVTVVNEASESTRGPISPGERKSGTIV